MIKKLLLVFSLLIPAFIAGAQSYPNGLLMDSYDPSGDSIAIARVRARMDSIRQYRPTVAVILAGGGAKGLAHLGVLKMLEELGIPVDLIGGTSMGGLVATMTGLDNADKVRGMILHYPALYMPQIANAYASIDDVPERLSFGEDYELGSRFVTDIWGLNVVDRLGEFTKPVTIIQGSDDQLVAATSIEEASHYFPNAEFHLIDGAGHGFSGDDFDTAVKYGLDYLFANT